jgi:hypothetical protein
VIKSLTPGDPGGTDPTGLPWLGLLAWVVALVVVMFGGSHVVEQTWGIAAALAWQGCTTSVWLLSVCLWLALRGGGKRG